MRQINSELLCFLRHPTVVQISIMTKRHSQPTKVPVCVKISPFTSFWTFPRGLASCSRRTESVGGLSSATLSITVDNIKNSDIPDIKYHTLCEEEGCNVVHTKGLNDLKYEGQLEVQKFLTE